MLTVEADKQPTISGGPLGDTYEFTQMHFHWGENDEEGSEDTLDGRRWAHFRLNRICSARA